MPMLNTGSLYCENLSDSFFISQPFNTLTNLAFFIAGLFLIKLYRKYDLRSPGIVVCIGLVFLIGMGSTIWHSSETLLGELLDIIPISLLILTSLALFLTKVIKMPIWGIALTLIGFLGINFLSLHLFDKEPLRSSSGYFPAILMLGLMGIYTYWKKIPIYKELILALITFLLSITFRSLDHLLCEPMIIGTHFMWHILNGLLVYLVVRALIEHETI